MPRGSPRLPQMAMSACSESKRDIQRSPESGNIQEGKA